MGEDTRCHSFDCDDRDKCGGECRTTFPVTVGPIAEDLTYIVPPKPQPVPDAVRKAGGVWLLTRGEFVAWVGGEPVSILREGATPGVFIPADRITFDDEADQ